MVPFCKISKKYPVLETNWPFTLIVGCLYALFRSSDFEMRNFDNLTFEGLDFELTGIPCTVLEDEQ